jgi:hypothetical protein
LAFTAWQTWHNIASRAEALLLFGQPNFFTPRPVNPFLVSRAAPQEVSFYDTAPMLFTLQQFADFSLIGKRAALPADPDAIIEKVRGGTEALNATGLAGEVAFRISLLAIGLVASFAAGAAVAGALVEFPNLPRREPAHLIGYHAWPDAGLSALASSQRGDNAPHPAVVVLHGCSGISSHSAAIADRLGARGYVALTADTLGPRHHPDLTISKVVAALPFSQQTLEQVADC